MNNYWHLLSNHLPIIGSIFSCIILLIGIIVKNKSYVKLALGFTLSCGILSFIAHITGENAEHFTEKLIFGSHDAIENHEKWAFYAFIGSMITAIISLFYILLYNRLTLQVQNMLNIFVLVLLLIVNSLMFFAGKSGGQIRHEELRPSINKTIQQ